jgi:hypothetical protein
MQFALLALPLVAQSLIQAPVSLALSRCSYQRNQSPSAPNHQCDDRKAKEAHGQQFATWMRGRRKVEIIFGFALRASRRLRCSSGAAPSTDIYIAKSHSSSFQLKKKPRAPGGKPQSRGAGSRALSCEANKRATRSTRPGAGLFRHQRLAGRKGYGAQSSGLTAGNSNSWNFRSASSISLVRRR